MGIAVVAAAAAVATPAMLGVAQVTHSDLALSASWLPGVQMTQDELVTFRFTITNNGPDAADAGATFEAAAGNGLRFVSLGTVALAQCVIVSDQAVQCVLDAGLAGGAAVPLELTARVLALPDAAEAAVTVRAEVSLPAGGEDQSADTAAAVSVLLAPAVTIGDLVWFDQNHNGIQDDAEPGMSGLRVKLFDKNFTEVPAGPDGRLGSPDDGLGGMFCDATGNYRFTNLAGGRPYMVEFGDLPEGFEATRLDLFQ